MDNQRKDRNIAGFLAGLLISTSLINCSGARASEVFPLVEYSHTSDILRGPPFNNEAEGAVGSLGGGITLVVGKRKLWELDFVQGVKWFTGLAGDGEVYAA